MDLNSLSIRTRMHIWHKEAKKNGKKRKNMLSVVAENDTEAYVLFIYAEPENDSFKYMTSSEIDTTARQFLWLAYSEDMLKDDDFTAYKLAKYMTEGTARTAQEEERTPKHCHSADIFVLSETVTN